MYRIYFAFAYFVKNKDSEAYSLVRNLISPAKPTDKTFTLLVGALKEHLIPTPIKIAERYKFYHRNQQTGESLNKYIAELRKLSEHCQFGFFLGEALCDKFVCGMSNPSIRKRLQGVHTFLSQKSRKYQESRDQLHKKIKT